MYKNVTVIVTVIDYIANIDKFYNYFIITYKLSLVFKSYKVHVFPPLATV